MNPERLEQLIAERLPTAPDDTILKVRRICEDAGVETEDDLLLMKEEDLVPQIKPILARKFLNHQHTHTKSSLGM